MGSLSVQPLKLGKGATKRLNKKLPTSGTPVNGAYATGTLGMATKPTADDTITIGTTVYTFVASPEAAGEVAIGAAVANSQANLVAAINGDDFNTAHPSVVAADFESDEMVITAKISGIAANSLATTETFADETDAWGAATMTGGVAETHTAADVGDLFVDDTYLYVCVVKADAVNRTAASFRRVALGSAY